MTYKEWIDDILRNGLMCDAYSVKLSHSFNKKAIIDLLLDANGGSWLMDMDLKGHGIPYGIITNEFGRFINGRYISHHYNDGRETYTGSLYCSYDIAEPVNINATNTLILGCNMTLRVKEYDFVRIIVDNRSLIKIDCPSNSRCIIESWGNAVVDVVGDDSKNIKIIHK